MSVKVYYNDELVATAEDGDRVDILDNPIASITKPEPEPEPPQPADKFLWIDKEALRNLPTTGQAWEDVKKAASEHEGPIDLSAKDTQRRSHLVARALVGARLLDPRTIEQVHNEILDSLGSEGNEEHTLAPSRGLLALTVAADLAGFDHSSMAKMFKDWLIAMMDRKFNGDPERTIRETSRFKANNFGSHALAARTAVAIYLNDEYELDWCWYLFRGWCDDRAAWKFFQPHKKAAAWSHDFDNFTPINPVGTWIGGHTVSGCIPDDMWRSGNGEFNWPPERTNYPWITLQGLVATAELLHNQGYPAWAEGNQAISRAVNFLRMLGWEAEGGKEWLVHVVNKRTGTMFATGRANNGGEALGWGAWTHCRH